MLELPPDVETRLREKAAIHGQNVGDYLRLILDQNPVVNNGTALLKPENYPREGEDWTEEDVEHEIAWATGQVAWVTEKQVTQ